jgi:translation initiation factor 2 subunit 2
LDPVVLEAFSGLKKKKKQIKQQEPIEQDEEEVIEQTQEPIEQTENLFGDLKKKKKKKKIVTEVVQEQEPTNSVGDYTYQELLTRVYAIIREANPELSGEKGSYKIVPPQILREGTKKTAFANIIDISKRMKRAPDHVIQFLFAELGTSGSIDGNQRLVIKGRFQQKQIETVLKRYISIFYI